MFHALFVDNKTARVFEANVQERTLEELAVFRNVELGRHERDLVSDRPGRMLDSASGIHHSYEPNVSARHRVTERWLKSVGLSLRSLLAGRATEGLILVAAPRTLAEVRASLPASMRGKIRAEIPRNLVKQSQHDLAKRVQPTLRAAARKVPGSRPAHQRSLHPPAI